MIFMDRKKGGQVVRKIASGVLVILLALTGMFLAWGSTPAGPMDEAKAALQSGSGVEVNSDAWVVFQPAGKQPETGFIFYPGGRVDYRAYAPLAQAIAGQGFLAVIVPMPLSLAVFAPDRAADVVDAYPNIQRWVIGGHSLGGAMAARYAAQRPGQVDGLVLLASYPAESDSLENASLPVLSIYGVQDGLATPEKIEVSRAFLPEGTRFVAIEGGNHAQFGWYGAQEGDGQASISRADQQDQTMSAIAGFMAGLESE